VVLVFPSEEVLRQFQREIDIECAIPYTIEKAADVGQSYSRIVLASQNTLWNRVSKYEPDRLCIFDECHHENLNAERNIDLLRRFNLVFGFSASPWSHGCQMIFDAINFVYPLNQAIADNICAPYALEPWPDDAAPRQSHELFFCESNQEAKRLSLTTQSSDYLTYESRDDGTYARKLSAFHHGVIKRRYCNRMLTEGFDDNRISSIHIRKETKSDILNYQMVGRALRYLPGKVAHIYCANGRATKRVQAALHRAG
jgi:superfamily II DNA or RNA helicase